MKKLTATLLIFIIGGIFGFFLPQLATYFSKSDLPLVSPAAPTPKPLAKYTFTALQQYQPVSSQITIDSVMFTEPELTAHLAHFTTQDKKMTMQIMVPNQATPSAGFPVIFMIRGFADPSIYQTGVGTRNGARYFASRGFVTVAPDFLGFGGSDNPPVDAMAARLEKPTQMLDLVDSLKTLPFVDSSRLGIWGHSNGGQISLSLLEITNQPIPTVLWAPVTKPFPYSLLFYTDEYGDGGKALRKTIATFETDYDVFDYSLDKYIDRLTGPIQLHQGGRDDAVPIEWSDEFTRIVNKDTQKVEYFTYPQADHNMQPDWGTVAARSYQFFIDNL